MPGIQDVAVRTPPEWEKALPGFGVWFSRFIRDVLAKADIRNAVAGGSIVITSDGPTTVASITDDAVGSRVFAPRNQLAPPDQGQSLGEIRTFARATPSAPVEYADAQRVLAHRIFGG